MDLAGSRRFNASQAVALAAGAGFLCLVSVGSALAAQLYGFGGLGVLLGLTALAGTFLFSLYAPAPTIHLLFAVAFVAAGASRYVDFPTGLTVDVVLLAMLVAVTLSNWHRAGWEFCKTPAFVGIGLWTLACVAQLANPYALSRQAWFYAVRGLAFYWFAGYPLLATLLCPSVAAHDSSSASQGWRLARSLTFTIVGMALLGALWGIRQNVIGLDPYERAWLSMPGNESTHMLQGHLRTFSFFSDTAQFGVCMAYTALMAVVLACGPWRLRLRVLLLVAGGVLFSGCMLSGTRSAYLAFFAGFPVFLLLRRKPRVIVVGALLMAGTFGVLKFTYVGQSIYAVQRMRQVVSPMSDPSFLVRLENQKRLAVYLQDHPMGGGIGAAGYWGQRFTPGTFLAELPLDSWYVRIAAEQGYPGLGLYLVIILGLGARGIIVGFREKEPRKRNLLEAYVATYWGVALASYSNQYLGQIPTGFVMLLAIVLIELAAAEQRITKTSEGGPQGALERGDYVGN